MKILKKLLLSILIVTTMMSISQIAFINLQTSSIVEASTIKLNKTKLTLYKGKTYTLKVSGTKKSVKWSSSNSKIATVNSKGKVTAEKKGSCTITAKVGNKKYKCKVTIKNNVSSTVYITKTGTKYHRAGCNYLKKSKISINVKNAKARGYTPCSRCNP